MMVPAGIGSRYRILSGVHRGRVGTIVRGVAERPLWWAIDIGERQIVEVSPEDIAGAHVQRLADAPVEADPLFAEINVLARAVDLEAIGQVGGIVDAIRNSLDDEGPCDGVTDADWFASQRLLFCEVAALALAGIRGIDRGAR